MKTLNVGLILSLTGIFVPKASAEDGWFCHAKCVAVVSDQYKVYVFKDAMLYGIGQKPEIYMQMVKQCEQRAKMRGLTGTVAKSVYFYQDRNDEFYYDFDSESGFTANTSTRATSQNEVRARKVKRSKVKDLVARSYSNFTVDTSYSAYQSIHETIWSNTERALSVDIIDADLGACSPMTDLDSENIPYFGEIPFQG